MKIKKISTKTPDNSKVLNQQSSSTTDTYSCNYVNNLIDIFYPVGSLYWTSQNVNPATLFGGTWQQITDTFILAAGSTYTNGDTGGEFTHTLTVNELPSHTHTFTGTAHSHGLNNHTHTIPAHAHGLNSHTHSVGAHSHGLNSHTHTYAKPNSPTGSTTLTVDQIPSHNHLEYIDWGGGSYPWSYTDGTMTTGNNATHESGTRRTTSTYYINTGNKGGGQGHTHTIGTTSTNTGAASGSTANSTAFNTGAASGNTANSAELTSGKASGNTTEATQGGTNSNTGGGQAFNITPKYLVRYCWERIA